MTMGLVDPGAGNQRTKNNKEKELMNQLKQFLEGVGKGRGLNPRLSGVALNLLKNLPCARDAVFEYYSVVFDRLVANYTPSSDAKSCTPEEEEMVGELQEVLSGFVETNPGSWAPIISQWSLDTLGKLCYQYGGKMSGKGKGERWKGTLHDKVACWLGCLPTRFLIEISAECLSKQIDEDSEGCVSALLETSVKHSPYFDWVVAHLGSCFPHTLIRRVLAFGFTDFLSISSLHLEQEGRIIIHKAPKLMSVMSILSHLGRNHATVLQEFMYSLILASLTPDSSSVQQRSTVPYILFLCSVSPQLSQALVLNLPKLVTQSTISILQTLVPLWNSEYFSSVENLLLELVTKILLSSDSGVGEVLLILIKKGSEGVTDDTARCSRMIVNSVISALFQLVHGRSVQRVDKSLVVESLTSSLPLLLHQLLSSHEFIRSSSLQLLVLYAIHKGRSASIHIIKYLLFSCSSKEELTVLVSFISQVEMFHTGCVPSVVAQGLKTREGDMRRFLKNLVLLVEAEKAGTMVSKSSFIQGVRSNQTLIAEKLVQSGLADSSLHLLRVVPLVSGLRINSLHRIAHCLIELFFSTLVETRLLEEDRDNILYHTEIILRDVCKQQSGLNIVLRFILEASIHSPYSSFLTSQIQTPESWKTTSRLRQTAKLYRENFKFGSMPVQPLGSSTVFHAGVIGDGIRAVAPSSRISEDESSLLRQLVSGIIIRLCESVGSHDEDKKRMSQQPLEDGCKKLSLILVEIISPDIMYNGIPWPEEEFIKVTMERDLGISKMLTLNPLLWNLLELLALNKPALCYSSVIIRAAVSVCITHWQGSVCTRLTNHPVQLNLTRNVINLMGLGQFIPQQLAVLSQILDILDPTQLHCILVDIWNYMRVNVPGPNMFSVCEKTGIVYRDFGSYQAFKPYCDRLRMVMVSNLEKVSDLFKVCYVDAFNASAGSPVPSLTNGPFFGISDVGAQEAMLNSYPPTGQPTTILNSEASPANFTIQNSDPSSAVPGLNHVTSSGEVYPTAEVHNNGSYTNNGSS